MSGLFGMVSNLFGGGGDGGGDGGSGGGGDRRDEQPSPARPPRSPAAVAAATQDPEEDDRVMDCGPAAAEELVLASVPGVLKKYSRARKDMVRHVVGESTLRVVVADAEAYEYRLEVVPRGSSTAALVVDLKPSSNVAFDRGNHSMTWMAMAARGARLEAWSFVVDHEVRDTEDEVEFSRAAARAAVESQRKERFDRAVGKKAVDHEFVYDAFTVDTTRRPGPFGRGRGGGGGDDDAKYDDRDYMDWERDDEERGGGDDDDDDDDDDGGEWNSVATPSRAARSGPAFAAPTPGTAERNALMAVGMANNRTFVMRGAKVGVFKHDADDQLVYETKIPEVRTATGQLFTPNRVMLHERDRRLLMLNPEDKGSVYCMDLETEKVIDKWQVGEEYENALVRNIGTVEKYAQRTNEQMVTGVNRNTIFTLDPRKRERNKVAQRQAYSKSTYFSCVAATDEGRVAAASETGEIRLYNDVEKRAKTLLPGLGDPITGVDVTGDGKWILATTARYLLVVPTEMEDGTNGFDKPMGSKRKPTPIKLQLHPHDLAKHQITSVKFTAAQFNMGEGVDESWIVTSTGPYIITWDFKAVQRGDLYLYRVKREYQEVVADQFRYGKEDQVVVTLTDDVLMQRRAVRKP